MKLEDLMESEQLEEAKLRLRAISLVLSDTGPDVSWHSKEVEIRTIINHGGSTTRRNSAKQG